MPIPKEAPATSRRRAVAAPSPDHPNGSSSSRPLSIADRLVRLAAITLLLASIGCWAGSYDLWSSMVVPGRVAIRDALQQIRKAKIHIDLLEGTMEREYRSDPPPREPDWVNGELEAEGLLIAGSLLGVFAFLLGRSCNLPPMQAWCRICARWFPSEPERTHWGLRRSCCPGCHASVRSWGPAAWIAGAGLLSACALGLCGAFAAAPVSPRPGLAMMILVGGLAGVAFWTHLTIGPRGKTSDGRHWRSR